MMQTAIRIAAMIKRNVDLWYADVITYERFSARQAVLWTLTAKYNVDEEVIEIVKPRIA